MQPAGASKGGPVDSYDPTAVQSEILKIQKERMVSSKSIYHTHF
jgi:hypothetical protein